MKRLFIEKRKGGNSLNLLAIRIRNGEFLIHLSAKQKKLTTSQFHYLEFKPEFGRISDTVSAG